MKSDIPYKWTILFLSIFPRWNSHTCSSEYTENVYSHVACKNLGITQMSLKRPGKLDNSENGSQVHSTNVSQ